MSAATGEIGRGLESIRLATPAGRWIITATALGSGLIFLDGTVVNVALARIQSDLAAPLAGLQWIVNGYTLMLAALLLMGGGLGDTFGRKRIFLIGLAIFTAASIGCGLAPSLGVLIAARIVQGLGGALLVPGSLAMINAVMAAEDRGRAIGLWAGLSGVTTAVGPLLGGYLVQAVTWRAIFFINVPFALLTAYASRHLPENRDPDAPPSLDLPGAALTVVALGGLTYALIEGPASGWGDPLVLSAIALGVLATLLFPWREARARHPMVPLTVFRSMRFSGANVASIGVYFSLSGVLLFLVLDLQQVQGYTPLEAGLSLLPVTVLLLGLSPRVGGLTTRIGARPMMIGGPILVAAGFLLLLRIGRDVVYISDIFPGIMVLGLGLSLYVTPLTATVMSSVSSTLGGIASGVSNTVTRIASLLAIAVLGLIIVSRFHNSLADRTAHLGLPASARSALLTRADRLADDPIPAHLSPAQRMAAHGAIDDAYLDGFRWAMVTCALLCLSSAGISAITIRGRET